MPIPAGTKYIIQITQSNSMENDSNFPYFFDLSSALSVPEFKEEILTSNSVAVYCVNNNTLCSKYAIIDLVNNIFIVHFNGNKTTQSNTFKICVGTALNHPNNVSALSASGMQHYWGYDELSNTETSSIDLINGINVTKNNCKLGEAGKIQKSISIENSNATAPFGNIPCLNGVTEFTIGFFIKPRFTLSGAQVVTAYNFTGYFEHASPMILFYDNKISIRIETRTGVEVITSVLNIINPNEWHHVVFTFNNGTVSIYIDGQLRTIGTTVGITDSSGIVSSAHGYINNFSFLGWIDNHVIFNSAKSQAWVVDYFTMLNTPNLFVNISEPGISSVDSRVNIFGTNKRIILTAINERVSLSI